MASRLVANRLVIIVFYGTMNRSRLGCIDDRSIETVNWYKRGPVVLESFALEICNALIWIARSLAILESRRHIFYEKNIDRFSTSNGRKSDTFIVSS